MDRSNACENVALDEIDFALIKALEIDARKSCQELADKVGTTTTTAWRRLQRLISEQVITFVTIPDPVALGFRVSALIGINTAPGRSDTTAEVLADFPNVQSINLTTGRYDMLLFSIHRTQRELMDFLDEQLGDIPDVTHAETMITLRQVKASWRHLLNPHDASGEILPRRRSLTPTEQALIRELETDPRKSLTDLGKGIGMSRMSASRKLQTLLDENVLKVVIIPDSAKLGFGTQAGIFVRVRPGRINAVAQALGAHKRIHHVVVTAGRFDMLLWGIFRDSNELSDFIRTHVGGLPGVISHETMLDVSVPKRSFALLTQGSLLNNL